MGLKSGEGPKGFWDIFLREDHLVGLGKKETRGRISLGFIKVI